jgi:adenylate cyclase
MRNRTRPQQSAGASTGWQLVPTQPGFIVDDLWLLWMWAPEAPARGDDATYYHYRDRYREMANSLGFEGHLAWASEMG